MSILPEDLFEIWLPLSLRSHEGHMFATQIARVIGCPIDGHGFLPALRRCISCLDRLRQSTHVDHLSDYVTLVGEFADAISRSEDVGSLVRLVPDCRAEHPHYRLWFLKPEDGYGPVASQRIDVLLGVVLLFHIAENRELNNHRAEALITLLNAGRRRHRGAEHWLTFALGLDEDPLRLSQSSPVEHAPLQELIDFLVPVLRHLPAAPGRPTTRAESPLFQDFDELSPSSNDALNDLAEPADALRKCDHIDFSGSFVRWHAARARYATLFEIAGLNSWDMQSPSELRETTVGLARLLSNPTHPDARFALLLIFSLVSRLPIRLVLQLGFEENGDAWLDLVRRCYCWHLSQLIKREPVDPWILEHGYKPTQIVSVFLPDATGPVIDQQSNGGRTVQECFFGGMDVADIERHVQRLLYSHLPSGDKRKPYLARFAYSLSGTVLHVTKNQFLSGLIGPDLRMLAPSEGDYACVSQRSIHRALAKSYAFLALGPPAKFSGHEWVGSPLAPRPSSFRRAVEGLHHQSEMARQSISPRMDEDRFIEAFSTKAVNDGASSILLCTHRGSMLQRWSCGSVYACPNAMQIYDKITPTSTIRLESKTRLLANIFDAHRRDILSAARRLKATHPKFAARLEAIGSLRRPNSPVFFCIKRSAKSPSKLLLVPVTTDQVRAALYTYGIALNGGRHFMISQLIARTAAALLVRTITGHSRAGGQPFVPWGGVAPLEALNRLRPIVERIQKHLPKSWPSLSSAPLPKALVRINPKDRDTMRDEMISAFCDQRQLSNRRAMTFHSQTLAFHAMAVDLQIALCHGAVGLTPWACFLLSLCVVDGITYPASLERSWLAVREGEIYRAKKSLQLKYLNESRRTVVLPLQPLTIVYLGYAVNAAPEGFDETLGNLGRWLRERGNGVGWSADNRKLLGEICGVAYTASTVDVPPATVTAHGTILPAAALSLSSLARLAYGRPGLLLGKVIVRRRRSAGRSRSWESLAHVCRLLGHYASTSKRLGGEKARRSKLITRLKRWRAVVWWRTPEADGYAEYILAEADNTGALGHVLELSSLDTYVRVHRAHVESLGRLHPLDFTFPHWRQLQAVIEGEPRTGDLTKARALSIFRRYARYWRSRGALVPEDIFLGDEEGNSSQSSHSASEAFLPRADWQKLREVTGQGFELGSLLQQQALVFCDLVTSLPLRSAEPRNLRLLDFNMKTGMLSITESGFSHIKAPDDDANRLLNPARIVATELGSLRDRIQAAFPTRQYFFLDDDNAGAKNVDAVMAVVSDALLRVTGEDDVRLHSLRASAASYLAYQDIDDLVAAMFANRCPPPDLLPIQDQFLRITRAADQAGHHPLTAIKYYVSVWPIVSYSHRRRLHSTWRPSGQLATRIALMTPENLRQMASRHAKCESDLWAALVNLVIDRIPAKSLEALLAPPIAATAKADSRNDDGVPVDSPLKTLHYIACRLAGFSQTLATDTSELVARAAGPIELQLSRTPFVPTQSFGVSAKVLLASGVGKSFADSISRCGSPEKLKLVLTSLDEVVRAEPTATNDVIDAMQQLHSLLPQSHSFAILPEADADVNAIAMHARCIAPAVKIKPRSKRDTRRFRLLVFEKGVRSPRSEGDCTAVIRAFLFAQLLNLSFFQKGEK